MNIISLKYCLLPARILCVLIPLFIFTTTFGQKEANNWYFGQNAGITFNGQTVKALTNGKLSTYEGCATLSDRNGNLLFYTDGIYVWDNTHALTPNGSGLNGNPSSTQSAVVVPRPGNSKQYYIFTVDYEAHANGLQYSVFDMSLNSGKGDIVSSQKNIKLLSPTCEKITAVQHNNGKDYWVLTHKFDSDTIYAYLITPAGINMNPVKSKTGLMISVPKTNTLGYMKISPDGTKIAYANRSNKINSGIGDFNSSTGAVTNVWTFFVDFAYGLEFSSGSRYLYVAEIGRYFIYQFDAKAKTSNDFLKSRLKIDSANRGETGALQLAPDKKIYITRNNRTYLDVISFPDSLGKACDVKYDYVSLGGRNGRLGLPTFIQSYFSPDFLVKASCFGDTAWFSIVDSSVADSVHWTFGDKTSKKNAAKGYRVFHLFSDTGSYQVRSISFRNHLRDTNYIEIKQLIPELSLGPDTYICDKHIIRLGYFKEKYSEYKWNDQSKDSFLLTDTAGLYWLSIKDINGCYNTDTVKVLSYETPKVNLGKDSAFCSNYTGLSLDAKNKDGITRYKWSTGDTSQTYKAKKTGKYWVDVSNLCGIAGDSIQLKFLSPPIVDLPADKLLCDNVNFILDAAIDDPEAWYHWLSGETTSSITINKSGKYGVTVRNYCGEVMDSVNLVFLKAPIPNIKPNIIFCDTMQQVSRSIKLSNPLETVLWSGGGTDTFEIFTQPGKYWVKIMSPCGDISDTVNFKLTLSPKVYLGKDTSLCGNFNFLLDAGNPGMSYYWEPTGETSQTIIATRQTKYTVKVIDRDACFAKSSLNINANCNSYFWFPNSFTPNTDMLNETFKPVIHDVENYEMRIFDRWGELLFETRDIEKGWDGTYKGKICQDGVYFYVSDFIATENNSRQFIKGTLTLVK